MGNIKKEKTILFLGAGKDQLPAIEYARFKHKVITADNRPNNPGHLLADETYNIDTYDSQSLLRLAREKNVSAISCFASDPGVKSASIITEALGLRGNNRNSVEILNNKKKFRNFFKDKGFFTPKCFISSHLEDLISFYPGGKYIMKPVDANASWGVFIINSIKDITQNFHKAMNFSKQKEVIIEEFIEPAGHLLQGEGFVIDGVLELALFGDTLFSELNPFLIYMVVFQRQIQSHVFSREHNLVQDAITLSGLSLGGVNVEIIRDDLDRLFLVELAPRSGGFLLPELIYHSVGVNLAKIYIDYLLGENCEIKPRKEQFEFIVWFTLHVIKEKKYAGFSLPDGFKGKVLSCHEFVKKGDIIYPFTDASRAIGILIVGTNYKSDIDLLRFYFPRNL